MSFFNRKNRDKAPSRLDEINKNMAPAVAQTVRVTLVEKLRMKLAETVDAVAAARRKHEQFENDSDREIGKMEEEIAFLEMLNHRHPEAEEVFSQVLLRFSVAPGTIAIACKYCEHVHHAGMRCDCRCHKEIPAAPPNQKISKP